MAGMQIGYGSFRHPIGWAGLTRFDASVQHSPRGFKLTTEITATVQGEICLQPGEDEYDLDNYIDQLSSVYSQDGYDWGLYHTDGSPTSHYLWSNDPTSLTGNQIVYKTFPEAHGGEYVTGREFAYKIRNKFLTPDSLLIEYSDTVKKVGSPQAPYGWVKPNRFVGPYALKTANTGLIAWEHTGHCINIGGWFLPPAPLVNAPYIDHSATMVTRQSPTRYPMGFIGYMTTWSYRYYSDVDFDLEPTIR